MKSAPAALTNAIRTSGTLSAQPRLIADWNMNRYFSPTADNVPSEDSEGYDIELFPIESIYEPLRPTKGICKARINQATIGDDYGDDATNTSRTNKARYYLGEVDDVYKYWSSPYPSNSAGTITGCEPYVKYSSNVQVNKIVAKLENSWASPSDFTIQITTDGSTWSTIATNPTIRNDGQVVLYFNGTGWSSTRPTDITPLKTLRGIKIKVTKLGPGINRDGTIATYKVAGGALVGDEAEYYTWYQTSGKNSFFNLIALEAHREVDLSSYVMGVSDNFDLSDTSELYPVGTLTSNSGTIELSNVDGTFNKENPSSPFYPNLLDANVEFNLEYVYTVGGSQYSVQQFKMYGEGFTGQKTDTCTVELFDASKYLAETTPNPAMWEGLTVPQIVVRILDSVGFVDHDITTDARVGENRVPVFYMDGTMSVWEVLDELAKATQTVIFIDNYGILNVRTRDAAFDAAKTPVWTIRGERSGSELPDIIDYSEEESFEANHFTVTYQAAKWSDYQNGVPIMQQVWNADGTVALRSSPLTTNLETNAQYFYVPGADAELWPYKGKVNINGEIISFEGKGYIYYTYTPIVSTKTMPDGSIKKVTTYTNEIRNVGVLLSADDKDKFDAKTPGPKRFKNHFSGGLKITERGAWNSDVRRHIVDANGYSIRHIIANKRAVGVAGFTHNKSQSMITLASGPQFKAATDLLLATHGGESDSGFYVFGTKFRFPKDSSRTHQTAGFVFNNNSTNEDGYYIEIRASRVLNANSRKSNNELIFYTRKGGKNKKFGGVGIPLNILEDVWYELDVYIDVASNGNHNINIWVDGVSRMKVTVTGADRNAQNGKFGVFTKGKTKTNFEYLYGLARKEVQPPDDASFFDLVHGGYRGGMWEREWVYGWRTITRRNKKKSTKFQQKWNRVFFDEFGPIVHEIREFDVKFDPSPVLHSELYLTNYWNSVCTEYRANPFGAKFVVANTSRINAIVNGEDSLTFLSTKRKVNQILAVLGRPLVISEAEKVVVKNDDAIARRGKIESELSNRWIQSEAMAKEIADWMNKHWGAGTESATVQLFGNPLIELGDVVKIAFSRINMPESKNIKFFVTGVETAFDNGVTTTLKLRRIV